MRKSTLFISAVLTTFMLAVLFGVVSAYQQIILPEKAAVLVQPAPVVQQVSQPAIPAPVQNFTPEQAAALASQVIGRTDLYSVEKSTFNGVDAYLVTFSSGDLVYVSLDGQIVSISKLPVTTISQASGSGNGGQGNHSNGGSSHESEHENDDD